jgi:SAM-dependent methyltransferase
MKERIKNILKKFRVYHPLQSLYRAIIFSGKNKWHRLLYKKYEGRGFICNNCGAQYEKFVDDQPGTENREALQKHQVIAGYGENIICPNCMSTARERLVLAMLNELNLQDKAVLHFSPEKNIHAFIKRYAAVTTADLSPGFYRPIDAKIQKADATGLVFADHSFDLVIANHIMEHIPDDKKALAEIFRVLKPGGSAVLQVPYSEVIPATLENPAIDDPGMQSKLYGQKDHVRIYALDDYISRLQLVGFDVTKIGYEELQHLYPNAIQKKESFLKIQKPVTA